MTNHLQIVLAVLVLWAGAKPLVAGDTPPTFNRDVAPIVFEKCTGCHRQGEAAPFTLETYQDVRKRGELIRYVVESGLMPPWKAATGDVAMKGDRRLQADAVKTLQRWIENGMPEGDPADLPPLPDYPDGWQLGTPDLVLAMPRPFEVPAEGPDIYRNFVIPTQLPTDKWVKAVEFRPAAPAVVHHSLFFLDTTQSARSADLADPLPGFRGGMARLPIDSNGLLRGEKPAATIEPGFGAGIGAAGISRFGTLGGWALGAQPNSLPDGLAYQMPAGSDLVLSTHFHPSGKVEQEASTIGIYFADAPPRKRFAPIQLPPAFGAFAGIDIPPGSKQFLIEDEFVLPVDVMAFSVGAHAHYLGKTMTLTARLPSGETLVLLEIPDWDFAWQEQYDFAQQVPLPKGTVLHSRITYDNSAENPSNPRIPPVRVRFGRESEDEMGSITLRVVAADEADFPKLHDAYQRHFQEALRNTNVLNLLWQRVRSR